MIRRVGIFAAWFAITVVAIGIAATAVGSVRGQVTDVPAIPTAGTAALLASSSTTTTPPSIESSTSSTSTTQPPTTMTSVIPDETTTTTTTIPPSTTTTTAATQTTSTTSAANEPEITSHRLVGGQVTISALAPTVTLVAAVPAGGFSAKIEDGGPDEVRVEFESEGHKSSFRAEWEDGELDIDIDEEEDDD